MGGGYDNMQQVQQVWTCPECPVWNSGFLDGPLQYLRAKSGWADIWILLILAGGVILLAAVFSPAHKFFNRLFNVIKTAWKITGDKK